MEVCNGISVRKQLLQRNHANPRAYYDTDAPYPHWHPATELFFVLSGEAQVTVEEETFTVQEEDIFLINANDVHLIEGADCKMLSLRFQIDKLPYFNTARIPRFALCSSGNTHAPRYDYVRYLMAQFVKMNADGEHIYKTLSIVFTLYSHLTENFIAPPLAQISLSRKNHERVLTIMEYINDHYTECLIPRCRCQSAEPLRALPGILF